MKSIIVELAGKEWTIQSLPIKKSREWRKLFTETVAPLVGSITEVMQTEIRDAGNLAGLAPTIQTIAVESTDILLDLIYAYSPELKHQSDLIEDNAYDDEVLKVFMEVLKLAYPFISQATDLVQLGLTMQQTGKNSS